MKITKKQLKTIIYEILILEEPDGLHPTYRQQVLGQFKSDMLTRGAYGVHPSELIKRLSESELITVLKLILELAPGVEEAKALKKFITTLPKIDAESLAILALAAIPVAAAFRKSYKVYSKLKKAGVIGSKSGKEVLDVKGFLEKAAKHPKIKKALDDDKFIKVDIHQSASKKPKIAGKHKDSITARFQPGGKSEISTHMGNEYIALDDLKKIGVKVPKKDLDIVKIAGRPTMVMTLDKIPNVVTVYDYITDIGNTTIAGLKKVKKGLEDLKRKQIKGRKSAAHADEHGGNLLMNKDKPGEITVIDPYGFHKGNLPKKPDGGQYSLEDISRVDDEKLADLIDITDFQIQKKKIKKMKRNQKTLSDPRWRKSKKSKRSD